MSLAFACPIVHAQLSVFGSAALTNDCLKNNGVLSCKSDTGGVIGGVLYNFPIESRLSAGIDARASYSFGPRGGQSVTAAFRIGFVPHVNPLRPYFELGGGVVTSTFNDNQLTGLVTAGLTSTSTRRTSGGAEFAVGLDIRLTPRFDLRALELGATGGTVGGAFLDAGLVYHLHKRT